MKKTEQVESIINALNDAKAIDFSLFDVTTISSVTDFKIIASGRSNRQVSAIADKVIETMKAKKYDCLGEEGRKEGEWVLVDLGDVIVHVMHPDTREYYQLEKLWHDTENKVERQ